MPTQQKTPTQGYISSFDGLKIFWELDGVIDLANTKNKPVLFCYGLACSKNQWHTIADPLAKDHPCIFFDYRGHHRSDVVPNNQTVRIADLARDAIAVLDHLEIPEAHIFGHSMGCNVALEIAFNHPGRVKSLVLVAGAAENPFKKILGLSFVDHVMNPLLDRLATNREPFYKLWSWILQRRFFLKLVVLGAGFNRKAVESQDIERYLDSVSDVSPKVFFELLHDLSRGDTVSLLPRIKTPTLVVSGGNDQVTPPEMQQRLASALSEGEYFQIPLGSHNVQLEFADYMLRKIMEFWSQRFPPSDIKRVRTSPKSSKKNET